MLAPSYQSYKIVSEVYQKNGKEYVNIEHPNTHNIRAARWYSEIEYNKTYGATSSLAIGTHKQVLGFSDGSITIFKGINSSNESFFERNPIFRDCRLWGWYVVGGQALPPLPSGVTAITLPWSAVGDVNGRLKSDSAVKKAIGELRK